MNNFHRYLILAVIIGFLFFTFIYFTINKDGSTKWQHVQIKAVRFSLERNLGLPIRIIHQSWKNENIPSQFIKYINSWHLHCYQNWTYRLWTDKDNLELVKTHYHWFLHKFQSFSRSIYRADVSRYIYMHHYGGIYTDLDNECLKPFEHLLANYSIVFGAMEGQFAGTSLREGYVQNSFFYSVPRHKFWLELLKSINSSKITGLPEFQTGPVFLSNFIRSYRASHLNDETIKVYEPVYFNPFSWLNVHGSDEHCKDKGRMSENDWLTCRSYMKRKGSFVVQYHAHNWQ